MTSVYGTDPKEYVLTDYHEDRYIPVIHKNTVLGRITQNPQVKSFAGLIRSLPDIARNLNGIQSMCTIFVPLTSISVMDSYTARQVLNGYICDALISPELLQEHGIELHTRERTRKIVVERMCESVILNRKAVVKSYEVVNQSFIYYIDQML